MLFYEDQSVECKIKVNIMFWVPFSSCLSPPKQFTVPMISYKMVPNLTNFQI